MAGANLLEGKQGTDPARHGWMNLSPTAMRTLALAWLASRASIDTSQVRALASG